VGPSAILSVRPSVRMENLAPSGRIFMKFDIGIFFEKLITRTRKLTLLLNVKPDGASINQQALKS